MEANKNPEIKTGYKEEEEEMVLDFQTIYKALILNWQWFLFSIIVCIGLSYVYLRYTPAIYQVFAKFMIKEENGNKRYGSASALTNMAELGIISNSTGFDNEMEILRSHNLATRTVRDLKLYADYAMKGHIKRHTVYKSQPITVDVDTTHLYELEYPIDLTITRNGTQYEIEGEYYVQDKESLDKNRFKINRKISSLPASIRTNVGTITLTENYGYTLKDGDVEYASITSPKLCAYKYIDNLSIEPVSKTTTITQLLLTDEIPQRAIDYLNQLFTVYNKEANEDKNSISLETERFINSRLEKINVELGMTEEELESYKQKNNMVELKLNATQSLANQNEYSNKLMEIETQIALLKSIADFMNESGKSFQVLPSNVGLTDASSTQLINKYNELVLERNRLMRSASENSPIIEPITGQLTDLTTNIRRAIYQTRKNLEIQRNAIEAEFRKSNSKISKTPEQERILTQIGRQQEVKAELYIMLLNKREENMISLAATANNGKIIDEPQFAGKTSPKAMLVMLIGLLAGIVIPATVIFLRNFLRYKIEGRDDVARLTTLPIIGEVLVASNSVKNRSEIVIRENRNNQIDEIFRSIRTNLQFTLSEGQKAILFTSNTSGEGKTFNCTNIATSFALLNKKVVIVGLDIRKPRLAELFGINDHKRGITPLLIKSNPTCEDIKAQVVPSGVSDNVELLMAGPIPPNPSELLSRKSLDIIFAHLRELYDYIFIDTAPVGLVTDTLNIGRVADATVYICRADYTPKASFAEINAIARENKLPKVSVVINGIDMSKKKYGYAYGYGKYGKYGRYGKYKSYGNYSYGSYANSHYGKKDDNSIKR